MKIKKNIAISDSGYLFNPGTGESFVVNPIGKEILELMKENKDFKKISSHILERFNITAATFEKDYYDYMNTLRKNQLVEENEQENN